jgi:endoglucanase
MDEIGLIASAVDEHGFVRFQPIGGVYPRYLPGSRVRFLNGVRGGIGVEELEERTKQASLDQLYIDVGATSREDCPVKIGDMACFDRPFLDLGERVMAKSMDDRSGVAVLVETAKRLSASPNEVMFVFSVQEEVGTRGASPATFGVEPDLALAVDVTDSGDTPKGSKIAVELGKGAAIKVRDQGMLADPRIVRALVASAQGADVPYQLEVLEAGTTDARAIQISRAGVPTGAVSIPCRYVHSPSEVVELSDLESCVRLLVAFLSAPIALS